MVVEDRTQETFGSTCVGGSSSDGRDARSSAPEAPSKLPEAAETVNQLADSFREILMHALEKDPDQLQALTSLVSKMGLQAGDGSSQEEIDKMANSLRKLSVGANPADSADHSSSKNPRSSLGVAQGQDRSAPNPVSHKQHSTAPPAKPEPLSSEAQRVNDALQSLNISVTKGSQESEKDSAAFQFRAASPEATAQPGSEFPGASRKSPLRPAQSRPVSRRTRQRPSSQPEGTGQHAPVFGPPPASQTSPSKHVQFEFRSGSRHAGIMKDAIRRMDESAAAPYGPHVTEQPRSDNNEDVRMATEAQPDMNSNAFDSVAPSLPPQPPLPYFAGTESLPDAAKPVTSGPGSTQPSVPVAPFPQMFSRDQPRAINISGSPSVDRCNAEVGSNSRGKLSGATDTVKSSSTAHATKKGPPAVPFPMLFGGGSPGQRKGAKGNQPAAPSLTDSNSAKFPLQKPINPFSPASPPKINVQGSPQKPAELNFPQLPLFKGAECTAPDTTPAPKPPVQASEPSFDVFSGGSTGAGIPLLPTSPPILAFTAARHTASKPGSLNGPGPAKAQQHGLHVQPPPATQTAPSHTAPDCLQNLPRPAFPTTKQPGSDIRNSTHPSLRPPPNPSTVSGTHAQTSGSHARGFSPPQASRDAEGQSIPAWPSFSFAGPSSPELQPGAGGAAAAAGVSFGSAFHPGTTEQEGTGGSGRTPPSGRARKPKHHVLRNRAICRNRSSPGVVDRKTAAQRPHRPSFHPLPDDPKPPAAPASTAPFAAAPHIDLARMHAPNAANESSAPLAPSPAPAPTRLELWRPPPPQHPRQQQWRGQEDRDSDSTDCESTDSNDSTRVAQPPAAVPRPPAAAASAARPAAVAAGAAAGAASMANDQEAALRGGGTPMFTTASAAQAQDQPSGKSTGMAAMDFVFNRTERTDTFRSQGTFGPSFQLGGDGAELMQGTTPAAFQAPLSSAGAQPQAPGGGHVTPQIVPDASGNISPMSTAPPFHLQVKFTAASSSSGASPNSKAHAHSHRVRQFSRRRASNSNTSGVADHPPSPSSNPLMAAANASGSFSFGLPPGPAAAPPEATGTIPPQDTAASAAAPVAPSFHDRAKENNSPRSNSSKASAVHAPDASWQTGAVPAPQDALNDACEHRNRGNTLFKQKKYPEAEAEYSAALKALLVHRQQNPMDVKPRQIAVFYSNRAAAKLMLNRPQDALPDCHAALEADGTYRRALERAASCYRRMGDLKKAEEVLAQAVAATSTAPTASAEDRAALVGRLAEVRQLQREVRELWESVTTAEAPEALAKLNKDTAKLLTQLQDCPRVRVLRAAAQLRCGAWDAACSSAAAAGECRSPRIKLQAWWINCECLYAQGDLERCAKRLESGINMLRALEKEDGAGNNNSSSNNTGAGNNSNSSNNNNINGAGNNNGNGATGAVAVAPREDDCFPLPASARVGELVTKMQAVLRCKHLGNTAFQQKEYGDAERHYSAALAVKEVAAPAFTAILYSNRAAVHMEQKRWVDALADCGRARALNPSFHRVLRRLSKIHEELGRPSQALECLQELKDLGGVHGNDALELLRTIRHLSAVRQRDSGPHHFRMLNVATSAAVPELKTAFRKLAVQYHPDKALAGCVVTCSLSGHVRSARDEGLNDRLRTSANELFQLVNEAWETLQDSDKRHMCRMEHDEDYLQQESDTFAFMYESFPKKYSSSFPRRRW